MMRARWHVPTDRRGGGGPPRPCPALPELFKRCQEGTDLARPGPPRGFATTSPDLLGSPMNVPYTPWKGYQGENKTGKKVGNSRRRRNRNREKEDCLVLVSFQLSVISDHRPTKTSQAHDVLSIDRHPRPLGVKSGHRPCASRLV